MEKEIWKDIPGWAGYQVSNMGNVRTFRKMVGLREGKGVRVIVGNEPKPLKPCILHSSRKGGHLYVTLSRYTEGERIERWKVALIHRLVLLAFIGPCPDGMEVRHINGNPSDNRLENITYGTHGENMRDMLIHGTAKVGEDARDAKLIKEQVIEIRRRYADHDGTHRSLAKEYGVGKTAIASIIRHEIWKHIP